MGAVATLHPEVMAAEVEPVGGKQLLGSLIVDLDPFELEEDEASLDLGGPLRGTLEECADRRVLGVGREPEVGVVECPSNELGDPCQTLHRLHEPRSVEFTHPALQVGGELGRKLVSFRQQRIDGSAIVPAGVGDTRGFEIDQVRKVPCPRVVGGGRCVALGGGGHREQANTRLTSSRVLGEPQKGNRGVGRIWGHR